ncbi:AbrB family transcriptional regulator [Peribacillus loiseleuriae]|uniref:AbrB family transcriptional regulator n=1 Tax=Peribacillus loiseleuriae TaxID=1679170 RepID=UPI003807B74D
MKNHYMTENKWVQFLITSIIAILGALIFQLIHMPIPWLLGSMIFVLIGSKSLKIIKPFWPGSVRNIGMGIIGYTIGLSFTMSTVKQIGQQFPSMVLLTVLLLFCTSIIALFISRLSGIPFPTVLMGSIPGGLSQMIPLAEEIKGIDLTVVTFLQVSRLMMIIFFVPMLIFSPLFDIQSNDSIMSSIQTRTAGWGELFPHILVFAVVCTIFALLGKKIKFPTAFLLGPMIATIILNLSGFHGPALPSVFLNCSQLLIGGYIGLLLKPEDLQNKFKIALLAFMSGVVLIACSIGLSLLLTKLHTVTLMTAFLSLSPGGMDQMAIIAKEVNADLSVVICYQLFRTLFIFLVVPSLLKGIFKKRLQNKG